MPRYVQFPRSNVAGNVPTSVDPGSFAVNWADRRIYTGGPNSEPVLMAYRLSDHTAARSYREQDIVYHKGSLWRCNVAFASGPFSAGQWLELTDITTAPYKELSGTVWLSGGGVSLTDGVVAVSGGSGVVMRLDDAANPVINPVIWTSANLSSLPLNETLTLGIDANGALNAATVADATPEWHRSHIAIAKVTTDEVGAAVTANSIGVTQHQIRETLTDYLNIIGPFKTAGCAISLTTANTIRVNEGSVFWQGVDPMSSSPNHVSVSAQAPFVMRRATRLGYTDGGQSYDLIDPTQWDDGSVLSNVPAGSVTTQFIFLSSDRATGVNVYGQVLYETFEAAVDDVGLAWATLAQPAITAGMILLGAVITTDDGSEQTVVVSEDGFGDPFSGGASGGDTSQFLLITGTRAMTGDLDLGGNALVQGIVDGEDNAILPVASDVTGTNPGGAVNELSLNTEDGKVYSGADVVADRVGLYGVDKLYAVGDYCIENNNLYRCTTLVPAPEAFDPTKWQLIGADNSGALSEAVVINPSTPTRNTIDVTGQGGLVPALATTFSNDQSVDLYDFSPNAKISRFGIPTGAFAEDVFRVTQAGHPFFAVGQSAYFSGTLWQFADTLDEDRFPQAIIHEIIDANNFLLQVGGRINDLAPSSFVGDVAPTPGTYYYASETAGKLTATEGVTPVPVLYALSATQGIVKLTGTRQPTIISLPEIIDAIYPVGSVYTTYDAANPGLRWPGTTWVATAQGRAVVGVGSNGTSSWTAGQERGAETHTLTTNELAAHNHWVDPPNTSANTSSNGNHTHTYVDQGTGTAFVDQVSAFNAVVATTAGTTKTTSDVSTNHIHSVSINIPGFSSSNQGGGGAHNNIQPSIAIYMWQRTA